MLRHRSTAGIKQCQHCAVCVANGTGTLSIEPSFRRNSTKRCAPVHTIEMARNEQQRPETPNTVNMLLQHGSEVAPLAQQSPATAKLVNHANDHAQADGTVLPLHGIQAKSLLRTAHHPCLQGVELRDVLVWVHVLQVPLKAFALQPRPQRFPGTDVAKVFAGESARLRGE